MQDRTYYEAKFRDYPDVVTKKDFLVMLDNIDDRTATKLFKENAVRTIRIGRFVYIPKESIIDFLISEKYIQFRKRVEWSRCRFCQDADEKVQRKILLLCEQPQTRRNLMYMLDIPSIRLTQQAEDLERLQIYFRGHQDAVAYLKKIKAI